MLRDNSHFLPWAICKCMESSLWILKTAGYHSVIQRFSFYKLSVDLASIWELRPDHSSRKVLLLAAAAIISALWSLILGGLTFAVTERECQAAFKCWPKMCAVCLTLMRKYLFFPVCLGIFYNHLQLVTHFLWLILVLIFVLLGSCHCKWYHCFWKLACARKFSLQAILGFPCAKSFRGIRPRSTSKTWTKRTLHIQVSKASLNMWHVISEGLLKSEKVLLS